MIQTVSRASPGQGPPCDRVETVIESDGDLVVSCVRLLAPLPDAAPPHPRESDWIGFLRYRPSDGPSTSAEADAIAAVQPCTWGGAFSLDGVARNTVRAAASRGTTIEWWSLARRGDGVSDDHGFEAAKRASDPRIALDYYYWGAQIHGRRFAGFKRDEELRYTYELGLARAVHDHHEVLARELPDPHLRRAKVFCGGHSLGGFVVAAFGAWDFGAQGGVPGHDQCAGFFALDSLIATDPFGLRSNRVGRHVVQPVTSLLHRGSLRLMRAGALPRTYQSFPLFRPQTLNLLRIVALHAFFEGGRESDLIRSLPPSRRRDLVLRISLAGSRHEFLARIISRTELRATAEALLGACIANGSSLVPGLKVTMGSPYRQSARYSWCPVAARRMHGRRRRKSASAASDRQPAHIHDFARQVIGGPMGWVDPYFPIRLQVDAIAAALGARDGDLATIQYDAEVAAKPTISLMASPKSSVPTGLRLLGLLPDAAVCVPGYTHLDVVAAAPPRDGRDEPVSKLLAGFLARHARRTS